MFSVLKHLLSSWFIFRKIVPISSI